MAIRTYINKKEWLGNNNLPEEIFDELEKQGAVINEDGICKYFEIKDLNGLILATEKYIRNLYNKRKEIYRNIADFSKDIEYDIEDGTLTYSMMTKQEKAYIFVSCNLLNIIGSDNYDMEYEFKDGKLKVRYNLKPNTKVIFECY